MPLMPFSSPALSGEAGAKSRLLSHHGIEGQHIAFTIDLCMQSLAEPCKLAAMNSTV